MKYRMCSLVVTLIAGMLHHSAYAGRLSYSEKMTLGDMRRSQPSIDHCIALAENGFTPAVKRLRAIIAWQDYKTEKKTQQGYVDEMKYRFDLSHREDHSLSEKHMKEYITFQKYRVKQFNTVIRPGMRALMWCQRQYVAAK